MTEMNSLPCSALLGAVVQISQMYRILETLAVEGAVTMAGEAQDGQLDRRVNAITPLGRASLVTWLHEPLLEIEPFSASRAPPLMLSTTSHSLG